MNKNEARTWHAREARCLGRVIRTCGSFAAHIDFTSESLDDLVSVNWVQVGYLVGQLGRSYWLLVKGQVPVSVLGNWGNGIDADDGTETGEDEYQLPGMRVIWRVKR